jgi:pimeloyl-ACP methyl ester carboxylesterase
VGNFGKAKGVVICNPVGSEYQYAHRALRHLARLLSSCGCHVLRFDYYGTGDSAGDETEGSLAGWREDIGTAIGELKDSCGVKSVILIGLRVGATLAAEVAARRPDDVSALVLWDPAVSGAEHIKRIEAEWKNLILAHRNAFEEEGEGEGKRGGRYGPPISNELAFELEAIDLIKIATKIPPRTLLLSTERLEYHAAFGSELQVHPNGPIECEDVSDIRPWLEPDVANVGTLPLAAIGKIVTWLVP